MLQERLAELPAEQRGASHITRKCAGSGRRVRGLQHGSTPEAAELARVCQAALGSGLRGSLHSSAPEAAALSHGRAGHADARRPRGFLHGGAPTAETRRMMTVNPGARRSEPCAVEVAAQV